MHHVVTSWSTHGLRNPAPCEDVNLFAVSMVRGRAGLMSTSNLAASGEASQARILAALFLCFSVSPCEHVFFLLLPLASASVVFVSFHSDVTLISLSRFLFVNSDPQAALWLGASIGNCKPGKSFATQMVHAEQASSGMNIDNAGGKDDDLQDEHSTWLLPAVHCSRQQGVM